MWLRGGLTDALYIGQGMSEWQTVSTIQRELLLCELPTNKPGSPSGGATPTTASVSEAEATTMIEASLAQQAEPTFPDPRQDASGDGGAIAFSQQNTQTLAKSSQQQMVQELTIQLTSGELIQIAAIKLYSEFSVEEASALRAKAMKQLGGWSSGMGAWGSLGHVVMTSAVIGAIEHAISKGLSKEGMVLLAQALEAENRVRAEGKYLPIAEIVNLQHPIPSLWRVPFERETSEIVINRGFFSETETKKIVMVPCAYVHNGDEFVWIKADAGKEHGVRWAHVEKFVVL